jgi:hypothetical protein
MISNMPVFAGEDVVSLFLVKVPEPSVDNHCYIHTFYTPIPYLIYGKYNDYGAVEDFEPTHLDIILDIFRKHIVELEEGENSVHDFPVSRKDLDKGMDFLYEADHDSRLFVKTAPLYSEKGEATPRAVDHVVIKRSLFDKIINEFVWETYTGDGHQYGTFQDLMHNIDGAIEWLKAHFMREAEIYSALGKKIEWGAVRGVDDLVHAWKSTDTPPHALWLHKREWKDLPDPWIKHFMEAPSDDARREILVERIKFSMLSAWLSRARHTWTVPTGAGSQNQDMTPHKLLANFMLEEVGRYEAEYAEENYEEDETEAADVAA